MLKKTYLSRKKSDCPKVREFDPIIPEKNEGLSEKGTSLDTKEGFLLIGKPSLIPGRGNTV
jgi:hypothetical protein